MGVNKKVILKVALVFFLMAFTASVEARFNPSTFLAQLMINGDPNYITKFTTSACCDNCACTKSNPPQCTCFDIYQKNCPSTCKMCICTLPWPHGTCRCIDTTDHCYDPCSSDAKSHH